MAGSAGTVDSTVGSFAVVAFQELGEWQVGVLPEVLAGDLDGLVAAVRQQPGDTAAVGLVNVADEFFVAVRVRGDLVRILLSDVTAAVAWDLAAQVLAALELPLPVDEDLDEVWPAGDLDIFEDLGLDAMELGAILSDVDAYADETLSLLARRLGFPEQYEQAVAALVG